MNLEAEAPEKKKKMKKKKKTKPSLPTSSSSSPSFSLIPDDITVNCLARISRMYYPTLSIVSKSFHSVISSTTELYRVRSHLGNTEQCIYVCLWDESYQSPQWFTLWINPNKTLPDSTTKKRKKKKTIGQLLVPINSSKFPSLSSSTIVVGYEIYVVGGPGIDNEPSSAVQVLDCRSHTWREAPSMSVARKNHSACVYDGKIYVIGGVRVEDESWAEVFDIKTQTWERLPDPDTEMHKRSIHEFAEIQGKIHFQYYVQRSRIKCAYDPKQGKWESCNGVVTYPYSNCVIDGVCYRIRRPYSWMNSGDFWWSTDGVHVGQVKGLDSLGDKYKRNGGFTRNTTKLVSCGGKLYLIWEGNMKQNPNNTKKIWCAEIVVEKRDGGEVWGNVQWIDVVHSVPMSCEFLHCLVVSV